MRIDLGNSLLSAESIGPGKTAVHRAQAESSGECGDVAQLSTSRFSVAGLTAVASQLPEVRQEKVAALAAQLRAGTYDVSAKQTAEAMISQMRAA
jgi:flagellar biosynthesis anti-sigma factor FlgM